MSAKVRCTSSKFLLLTRKKTTKASQQISIRKGFFLVRGQLRKCLSCKGFPSLQFKQGFQPVDKPYWHLPDCNNKG